MSEPVLAPGLDKKHLKLQGLVDDGSITEGQALEIAVAILRENAKAPYAGKL